MSKMCERRKVMETKSRKTKYTEEPVTRAHAIFMKLSLEEIASGTR